MTATLQMGNDYKPAKPFIPHWPLRPGRVQTILGQHPPKNVIVTQQEQPLLLDAGPDRTKFDPEHSVQLLGYYTPSLLPAMRRGLVLTLHGWEGSSHSPYNLILADALVRAGYDVVRLNARDHGPNLHVDHYALNPGLYFSLLIDEVAVAVRYVAGMAGDQPFYIVGVSMGGSFAVRLAIRHTSAPFPNLQRVIAFNPPINPAASMTATDAQPPFRHYFRDLWLASLRAKERLFPHLYQFDDLVKLPLLCEMTAWLVERYGAHYGSFQTLDEFFAAYTVKNDAFQSLQIPTTIITAVDDPIVPVDDFYVLTPHPLLDIQIHPAGGHVGFVDGFPPEHQLSKLLLATLEGNDHKPLSNRHERK